ncbi:MAG TPA: hypothetical protein VFK06_25450 [Candidatus Angelobacter sp.]|nr:hypothetical protein [Candidatus Angelobacter sp.]
MFGGKIGFGELLLLSIIVILIGAIVVAVRTKRPQVCYCLGFGMIVLASLRGPNNIAYMLGTILGNVIVLGIIPLCYWIIAGRKTDRGKLLTSKMFFWLSFIIPTLAYNASHLKNN